jgi:hypothetical protein
MAATLRTIFHIVLIWSINKLSKKTNNINGMDNDIIAANLRRQLLTRNSYVNAKRAVLYVPLALLVGRGTK